jgi:hypothetical protein
MLSTALFRVGAKSRESRQLKNFAIFSGTTSPSHFSCLAKPKLQEAKMQRDVFLPF